MRIVEGDDVVGGLTYLLLLFPLRVNLIVLRMVRVSCLQGLVRAAGRAACLPACQQLVVDVVAEEEILESGGYETEVTV